MQTDPTASCLVVVNSLGVDCCKERLSYCALSFCVRVYVCVFCGSSLCFIKMQACTHGERGVFDKLGQPIFCGQGCLKLIDKCVFKITITRVLLNTPGHRAALQDRR